MGFGIIILLRLHSTGFKFELGVEGGGRDFTVRARCGMRRLDEAAAARRILDEVPGALGTGPEPGRSGTAREPCRGLPSAVSI